jgi:hypothetical protein
MSKWIIFIVVWVVLFLISPIQTHITRESQSKSYTASSWSPAFTQLWPNYNDVYIDKFQDNQASAVTFETNEAVEATAAVVTCIVAYFLIRQIRWNPHGK